MRARRKARRSRLEGGAAAEEVVRVVLSEILQGRASVLRVPGSGSGARRGDLEVVGAGRRVLLRVEVKSRRSLREAAWAAQQAVRRYVSREPFLPVAVAWEGEGWRVHLADCDGDCDEGTILLLDGPVAFGDCLRQAVEREMSNRG
jgi:Holliday junction resolvase